MKQSMLLSIILSLTYGSISGESISENARVGEAIRFIQVWLDAQRDYEGIPGISIALVHDQELLWSGGFGFSNPDKRNPTTSRTIHSICSISKLFTSIAIMQLRDKGELSLNDPIKKHLPWFNIENTYPEKGDVTIEGILTHSSGLPRESDHPYWTGPDFTFPSSENIQNKLGKQKTLYPANRYFQYSNLGLTLAGEIITAISGMDFDTYIKRNIIQPLKMRDTRTFMPKNMHGKKLAIGHNARDRSGKRTPLKLFDAKGIGPAAGFSSTVDDLSKFGSWQFRLLEQGGNEILNANTLREMHRVHWLDDDWDPAWGLGFAIWRKNEKKFVGHGGSCPGYRSSFILQPDSKIAVAFMSNASGVDVGSFAEMAYQIINTAIDAALDMVNIEEPLDPRFERYLGSYLELPWWGELAIIAWEGQLAGVYLPAKDPLKDLMKLRHIEGNTFRRVRNNGTLGEEIIFETDNKGTINKLWRHSNYAPKIR
tara:strand:+ start:801 stop:2249 length:1449 start_codon:yes stop_codon:yes gene_type:complete